MQHMRCAFGFVFCFLLLAGGWHFLFSPSPLARARDVPQAKAGGSGILDGMTFSGQVLRDGKPIVDVVDKWIFASGTFLSTECAVRCNYPRAPYYVRNNSGGIEFISESHCLDKNAKIVWRGTVNGSEVKGTKVWTISRWYWTFEKKFDFAGTLIARPAAFTSK